MGVPDPERRQVETTPIVIDGIMYISSANEVYALDAGSGRQIWHYQQPRTKGFAGNAAAGFNRGVAISGDRLFLLTDHAHMIALNRSTGELLWDTEMADWRENYNGTSAPLVVGKLVISGTAGGDEGVRGFVAAYETATGKEAWRFWTVPKPGEPGSETWQGTLTDHRGGAAWMTGTYDPQLDLVYWTTGNPGLGLQRRRTPGRQSVHRLRCRPRGQDGPASLALPVHSARHPRLGRPGDAGRARCPLAGPAAQAADPGEPQRVLLRARSDERRVAARQTIPEEAQLGEGHRREGAPRS